MTTAQLPAVPAAPLVVLPRPVAPRRAVLAAAGLGLASAALAGGRPGVGLPLLALVAAAVLVRTCGLRLRGWRALHAGSALLLVGAAAVRDAPWLVALDLLAAVAVGSLALSARGSWPGVARGLADVVLALPRSTPWLARGLRALPVPVRGGAPVVRGLALTGLLLVVFVPLLASADAAFAGALGALVPDGPVEGLPGRLVVGLLGTVAAAAAVLVVLAPPAEPEVGPPARRLDRTSEWLLPLAGLDALLAAFVLLQGSVLVRGEAALRDAGVTYATYTREGFGQLVAVTLLVLAVVALGVRYAPGTRGARAALGLLCGLALLVDASAAARLRLYVDEYGLTRLRVGVAATCLLLGLVLLVVLAAGLRPGRWAPHAVVACGAAVLLLVTAADPDAAIARSAVDRGAGADLTYLSGLSADAVPVLDGLPEPARSCVLRGRGGTDDGWTSANTSRARARQLLDARPPRDLGALVLDDCPPG